METRGSEVVRPGRQPTRRFAFLALLLIAVAAPAGYVLAGEEARPYIVVFDDDAVSRERAEAPHGLLVQRGVLATDVDGDNRREVDGRRVRRQLTDLVARTRVRPANVYASAVGGFSADLTRRQVRLLQHDASIAAVIPDEEVSLGEMDAGLTAGGIRTTTAPRDGVPAGVRRVGADRSTVARVDGRDSRVNADVAILDTGIERHHPDLNVAGGYNCTSRNRNKWDDDDGHGTHVAGIVGALDNRFGVVGVAPGARLWAVKVLDGNGRGRISWIVCGIDWVTAQRDRAGRPLFEVANMSISFGLARANDGECRRGRADSVHLAICRSVSRGIVYVVAAGNESHNARLNRPAAYDEVITVSALADFDGRGGGRARSRGSCPYATPERDDGFARFSNYGADVDLIAPGRCILSTYPRKRYAWMSGTSMASPHVAGAAALYKQMYPRATPQQVRMALRAVATRDWRVSTDPDRDHEKAVWVGAFRTMPDFSVSARASSSAFTAGVAAARARTAAAETIDVTIARIGGFEDPITLELVDPPTGISALSVSATETAAVLTVQVGRAAPAGVHTLVIRAASGDIVRTTSVDITVGGNTALDTTAPAAPSVVLEDNGDRVYLGHSGTLWVRGGTAGSLQLNVSGNDAESGIAANGASVEPGTGWRTSWDGETVDGRLSLSFGADARPSTLEVWATNGAGLAGPRTLGTLVPDSTPPVAGVWTSAPSGAVVRTRAGSFVLDWADGSDEGSGIADAHLVTRYRAPLNSRGGCVVSRFADDGVAELRPPGSTDTDLAPGACYAWSLEMLDNVGNAASRVWSGVVIVDPREPARPNQGNLAPTD